MIRFLKEFLVSSTETLVAIALVLASFVCFIVLLALLFPRGTSLADLVRFDEYRGGEGGRVVTQTGGGAVATLAELTHAVKSRPATQIAWSDARGGMELGDGHAIQTLAKSEATISFDAASSLHLAENSLVVIKRLEPIEGVAARRASLEIRDGEVRGIIGAGSGGRVQLELPGAGGAGRVTPSGNGPTDVRVAVNPDRSKTISVFAGKAEIAGGDRKLDVGARYSVIVSPAGVPGSPELLPPVPEVVSPAPEAALYYRATPPDVQFAWHLAGSADKGRLVIATDRKFENVILDERLSEGSFTSGNLEHGTYYWHVSGVHGWHEGEFSAPRKLEIVQDTTPPVLHVDFPEGTVTGASIHVKGRTEAGAKVFIGKVPVPASPRGEFEQDVPVRPGMNVVVVEAVDAAGNVGYLSHYVNAK